MSETLQAKEYTGTWIPAEIMEDERLLPLERILYAEIASYKKFFGSNAHLAARLQTSERNVQRLILSLKNKHYITQESFDGRRRVLRVCHDVDVVSATTPMSSVNKSIDNSTNRDPKGSLEAGASSTTSPKAPGAVSQSQYGNPEVNELFSYWSEIMGSPILPPFRKNRYAAHNLLRSHGLEAVRALIRAASIALPEKYAPHISDFVSLQAKINDLVFWVRKTEAHKVSHQIISV